MLHSPLIRMITTLKLISPSNSVLGELSHFKHMKGLEIEKGFERSEGLIALANAWPPHLESLTLQNSDFTNEAVEAIIKSPNQNLTEIHLVSLSQLSADILYSLARCNLRAVSLLNITLEIEPLRHFLNCVGQQLEKLQLGIASQFPNSYNGRQRNHVDENVVSLIVQYCKNLEELSIHEVLSRSLLNPDIHLQKLFTLPKLTCINVSSLNADSKWWTKHVKVKEVQKKNQCLVLTKKSFLHQTTIFEFFK